MGMGRGIHMHQTIDDLRDAGWDRLYPHDRLRINVGMASCGQAAGAQALFDALTVWAQKSSLPIDVHAVGCMGLCWAEPLVEFQLPGMPRAVYGKLDKVSCEAVFETVCKGEYPEKHRIGLIYRDWFEGFDDWVELADADGGEDLSSLPYLKVQTKRVSAAWGHIEPWSLEEYCAVGGYRALQRVLDEMTPNEVIDLIDSSGLRGRGGAGFPTGRKWRMAAEAVSGDLRYVIANADEGDPGAYMDRGLMESDPHRLIEGMAIAAFAVGASEGYVFTRAEYPRATAVLELALSEAREGGLLGREVIGSAFSFDITIVRSAGAYVCGEETAMISVLEGNRPDPRRKPPYPTESGLFGRSTCVNNVETLANVPSIILHGSERFRSLGTEESPGTKVFSLAGKIKYPGLVEVPFGMPLVDLVESIAQIEEQNLRNIVYEEKRNTFAAQIGGPSGAILPLYHKDLRLDFEGLTAAGGIIGSGGIVFLGHLTCIVDTVRYFLEFSARESCGQCRSCREGLSEAVWLLTEICSGRGERSMIDRLDRLCETIPKGSRCGLGKMSVMPLKSGLAFFREVFEEHIDGTCRGLVCKDLMHFQVIESACPGCLCCLPSCPTGAIKGRFGKPFHINQEMCSKCWMCVSQCPYPALTAFPVSSDEAVESEKAAFANGSGLVDCILCGKCVDVCRERGSSALFFAGMGSDRHLVKPLLNGVSSCTDCGACSEVCPTHAIDALSYTETSSGVF